MKKTLLSILISLPVLLSAQTVSGTFAGWATVASVSGTGPYIIAFSAFNGNEKPFGDLWDASDITAGDILWTPSCSRFVVQSRSGNSVTVTDPDPGSATLPIKGSRIGFSREFYANGYYVGAVPQSGDGNSGPISGIGSLLFSCVAAHYSEQLRLATLSAMGGGGSVPSGTANYTLRYVDPTTLAASSVLKNDATNIGVNLGASAMTANFDVSGTVRYRSFTNNGYLFSHDASGNLADIAPYAISASGTTSPVLTLNNSGGSITFTAGAGGVWDRSGSTFNYTPNDASASNEGALSVLSGSSTSSVLHSNTTGSTDVTFNAGAGISISENTGTGNITLVNSSPDQTVTIAAAGHASVSGAYPGFTVRADADADSSTVNEIQALSRSVNNVSLSLGGGTVSIAPDTDYQVFTPTSGNTVTVTTFALSANGANNRIERGGIRQYVGASLGVASVNTGSGVITFNRTFSPAGETVVVWGAK